jgi:YVTN family beta-propeller protein
MQRRLWLAASVLVGLLLGALVVVRTRPTASFSGTIPVGARPQEVALDSRTGHAFVTNYAANSVSVVDIRRGVLARTVPVVVQPVELALDPSTQRAFVTNARGDISVLDTLSGTVVRTLTLASSDPVGERLVVHDVVAADRAGAMLVLMGVQTCYAAYNGPPSELVELDARSGAVMHRVPVGNAATSVTVDPDTERAFVTNYGVGTISIVDLATGVLWRTATVGAGPQRIAVDETARRAFVTNYLDGTVSLLDVRTGGVLRTVAVGPHPTTVVAEARDGWAVVLTDNGTTVLDAHSGAVLGTYPLGAPSASRADTPANIVVDARTSRAFIIDVGNYSAQLGRAEESVGVLDLAHGTVQRHLSVGRSPVALALDGTREQLVVVNLNGGSGAEEDTSGLWRWVPPVLRPWLPWYPRPVLVRTPDRGSLSVFDAGQDE